MAQPEHQLRLVQLGSILFLVVCILFVHLGAFGHPQPASHIDLTQGVIIVLALWSAISGFTVQRKLQAREQSASLKSTPFTRWRAGHLVRLASAVAVGMWGLILFKLRGGQRVTDVLFGVALILLLTWKPGGRPAADAEGRS
jgi:hypothetical protein